MAPPTQFPERAAEVGVGARARRNGLAGSGSSTGELAVSGLSEWRGEWSPGGGSGGGKTEARSRRAGVWAGSRGAECGAVGAATQGCRHEAANERDAEHGRRQTRTAASKLVWWGP